MSDDFLSRARGVVRDLPADARIVGVLSDPSRPETVAAVVDLATLSAGRGRVLLVNFSGPDPDLDRLLGAEDRGGLSAVLAGAEELADAAVRPEGRPFLYLPAGEVPDGAPSPLPAAALRRLGERVSRAQGLLLVHLTPDRLTAGDVADVLDGVVCLGDVEIPQAVAGTVSVLDRLDLPEERETPVPEPDLHDGPKLVVESGGREADGDTASEPDISPAPLSAVPGSGGGGGADDSGGGVRTGPPDDPGPSEGPGSDGEGEEEADPFISPGDGGGGGGWRRHRKRASAPVGRIIAGAAVILVLAVGWWIYAERAADFEAPPEPDPGVVTAPEDEPPRDPPEFAASEWAERIDAEAPELTFSVLVASLASRERAVQQARSWTEADGIPYFVAPTRVGDQLFYRVFAGAVEDRAAAEALMGRLVDAGRKESTSAWDVRPLRLAYRMDVAETREAAESRREELAGMGIDAYRVSALVEGRRVHQLYAGGYENEDAAAPLAERLEAAGVEADLTVRRGEGAGS